MALPVVAIVGRPNVGKSTLFNALTRTRDALVADTPGVTRDRQYGFCRVGDERCVLVDTGGLVSQAEGIDYLAVQQVRQAIEESSVVIFLVSARDGLSTEDEEIAALLRKSDRLIVLVANKTDGMDVDSVLPQFTQLGMGDAVAVAASHRRGMNQLMSCVGERLPANTEQETLQPESGRIRIAIIGRPNVGKSTLINRLVGEERVLAFDEPGTTRDSISTPMERDGVAYELIDTAGVRRRARISEALEKFSVIKAMQAIDGCSVAVLMIDGVEGLTDQDLTLLGHVLERGRALVLAVNKWDGLDGDHRDHIKSELGRKLTFVPWAQIVTLSALHGSGIQQLMDAVQRAWQSATRNFSTSELTRVLQAAYQAHQPPMTHGISAKLRYAHSGGHSPPRIIIHGRRTETVPEAYRRYLVNRFIKHFKLRGTPLFISFRNSDNPYGGRRRARGHDGGKPGNSKSKIDSIGKRKTQRGSTRRNRSA